MRNNCGWYQQDVAVMMSAPPDHAQKPVFVGCDTDGSLLLRHLEPPLVGACTRHRYLIILVENCVLKVLEK
jgi:hypothetical protein